MTTSLKKDEDPVTERKKQYISEREIPALLEVCKLKFLKQ